MKKNALLLQMMLLAVVMMVGSVSAWGQGILSSPIFFENFGSLTDGTALTTSNTNFTYIRGQVATTYTFVAKSPGNFTGSSGIIKSLTTSGQTVEYKWATATDIGTVRMNLRMPATMATANDNFQFQLGVPTTAANGNSAIGWADVVAGFRISGTTASVQLGRNTTGSGNGSWYAVGTVSTSTNYDICLIFNLSSSAKTYGDNITLAANTCHLYIDGSKIGESNVAQWNSTTNIIRFFVTSNEFELDDVAIYNTLPQAPTTDPSDATLIDLRVAGVTIEGFDPNEDVYEYVLPYSATEIPEITWTTSNPEATAEITTEATFSELSSTGSSIAVITVTPVSGSTKDYYIEFTIVTTLSPSILAAWNFTGQGSTSLPTFAATTFDENLVAASGKNEITRGGGAAWSTGSNSFRTQGFGNAAISTSSNRFFQVTLEPATNYKISLSSIDAVFAGTNTYYATPGVTSQFAYSLDDTNFTLIGSPVTSTATSLTMSQIDLSDVAALQNVTEKTITLRYYASGQTTTGGWGFNSPNASTNGLAIGGFIDFMTSLDNSSYSTIKAYSANSVIYLNNLPEQASLYVYNIAGQLVMAQKAGASNVVLPIAQKGIYLIKVISAKGAQTLKVFGN